MAHRKNKSVSKSILVSFLVSAAALLCGLILIDDLSTYRILTKLVWPLTRLMFFISIGLLIGQIIETTGWTKTLAVVARPLFRYGNLGNHCSAAFTAAFFSGITANAMLLDFLKEGKITSKQLFLSNFINQLPAFFLHLPTTFFIVIPLTGLAGILYFILTFLAVLLRTVLFLIYGHFNLTPKEPAISANGQIMHSAPREKTGEIWNRIKSRIPRRLTGVVVYVVPIYIIVFVLNALGIFTRLREGLSGFLVTSFIPMESLSVIILSFAAESTSGFAAAGALMDAEVLTVKQTVIALLIGNVLAFPVRTLRHQLPRYIGIFSPKMGAQILFMGQGFRVASIILVGAFYYYVG